MNLVPSGLQDTDGTLQKIIGSGTLYLDMSGTVQTQFVSSSTSYTLPALSVGQLKVITLLNTKEDETSGGISVFLPSSGVYAYYISSIKEKFDTTASFTESFSYYIDPSAAFHGGYKICDLINEWKSTRPWGWKYKYVNIAYLRMS